MFPEDFRNEVQVLPTVLSYDNENEADILSIIASSAALSISGLPFKGQSVHQELDLLMKNIHKSYKKLEKSKLDLIAGTKDAVLMVDQKHQD